jgi:CelD/BcsL family acetyltransferase involved in cellulose biosynthesis
MQTSAGARGPTIEFIQGKESIKAFAKEWDAAIPLSFTAALGQSAWYLSFQEVFPTKEFVLVVAREGGRIVGLLPLALERTDARGLYFSQVTTFARGDYQPPIADPAHAETALPAMIDAAIEHFGRGRVYRWAAIPATDAAARILPAHFDAKGMSWVKHTDIASRLNINGRTYEQIEASWSKSHRGDVRRQKKRLAEKGALSLVQPQSLDEAMRLLHEFFDVHDEKWLSQGQPGRFRDPAERRHFETILQSMWQRGVMLTALRCGDVNVSFAFGFFSDTWVQWYRPSYRTQYEKLSPGKIHVAMMLEEACRQGWKGIDFLTGAEGYKAQWTDERLEVYDMYSSCRAWSPGYLWFTRGKPFVRERVGPWLAQMKARMQKLGSAPKAPPAPTGTDA